MPVENVYQNISNILQRIESIKKRFGISPSQGQVLTGQAVSVKPGEEQDVHVQGANKQTASGQNISKQVHSKQGSAVLPDSEQASSSIAGTSFGEELERKIAEIDMPNGPADIPVEKTRAQTFDTSGVDRYGDIIKTVSDRFGVPESLIQAVIKQESGFNNSAVSSKGAMGLMQLMPETANSLGVQNPFNPEENILGGTRYLVDLLNQYNGNLNLALAAYNAGPNRVENKIPGISETKNFIDSVLRHYQRYQKFNREEL